MSLAVRCPACDKQFKVKAEAVGKRVRCPECDNGFQVQAKAEEDDFLSDLSHAVTSERESPTTVDPRRYAASRRQKAKATPKKKSKWAKWFRTKGLLLSGLSGGGIVLLIIFIKLFAAIGQGKLGFNPFDQLVTWTEFKHPLGASIEMPGTPVFDPAQSAKGAQVYTLGMRSYRLSLMMLQLPNNPLSENPFAVELFFQNLGTELVSQTPGAKLISSRRLTGGTAPGIEMRMEVRGSIDVTRTFVVSNFIICAEHATNNEFMYSSQREKFFNSLRSIDGSSLMENVTAPANPADGAPGSSAAAPMLQASTLLEAHQTFQTQLVKQVQAGRPAPDPPASLAQRVQYDAPSGQLAAYLTTIPQDGQRHPAIIWISGGDCNSIDDGFFADAPYDNDQTANAFWKAGIVTMYPSLRGGNENPGFKEGFLGEIDDVVAAYDFLSKQEGIDPSRIYLGGHSTGGTVALLAAELSNRFRAVFSFGPAHDIRGYGAEFAFFDLKNPAELEIRNPMRWLDSIQSMTFVLEGQSQPGNSNSLESLKQASKSSKVTFLSVPRVNHFSILAPATRVIAEKILKDTGAQTNIYLTNDEILKSLDSGPPPASPFAKKSTTTKNKSGDTSMAGKSSSMSGDSDGQGMSNKQRSRKGKSENTVSSETVGGSGGGPFERHLGGRPMIGLDWRLGQWAGSKAMSGLVPVGAGDPPKAGSQRTTAPKGYAVGGILVYAPQFVSNIQLIYMKVRSDGTLDPDDTKRSEWLGGKPSGEPTEISGGGKLVVGIHGRGAAVVDAIGLLFEQ